MSPLMTSERESIPVVREKRRCERVGPGRIRREVGKRDGSGRIVRATPLVEVLLCDEGGFMDVPGPDALK